LVGGGAGRVKGGRHVKYPDQTQQLTNLQLTLLNKLGIPTETFGDSTGEQLSSSRPRRVPAAVHRCCHQTSRWESRAC
jgi:hypothetical protein